MSNEDMTEWLERFCDYVQEHTAHVLDRLRLTRAETQHAQAMQRIQAAIDSLAK